MTGQRTSTADTDRGTERERPAAPPLVRAGNRGLEIAEGVVYVGISVFLVILALGAFVIAARQIPTLFAADGAGQAALEILDTLLLVFIVVELLFAVRITIAKRELIAEPFLLVGIIASIKEIVVLSVKAPDYVGTEKLDDTIWLIGVLTLTIVALAASTLLMRRKEREPDEGNDSSPVPADGSR